MSPAEKLNLIQWMLEGGLPQPDCPCCGQPVPDKPLITPEQARRLLGFPDLPEEPEP